MITLSVLALVCAVGAIIIALSIIRSESNDIAEAKRECMGLRNSCRLTYEGSEKQRFEAGKQESLARSHAFAAEESAIKADALHFEARKVVRQADMARRETIAALNDVLAIREELITLWKEQAGQSVSGLRVDDV